MKDIKEIDAEDMGYSQRGGNNSMFVSPPMYPYMDLMSRNSYNGNSYNNNMDYNGGNSNRNGGYSRGSMMDHYEDMMANARTDQERETIRQMMMRMN